MLCRAAEAIGLPGVGRVPIMRAVDVERDHSVVGTPESRPPEPQLPVLRFGLKQLFWWVTGLCVLLGLLVAVPYGLPPLALLLAVAVVVLHVLSTAIGNRLGTHANDRRAWEANLGPEDRPPAAVPGPVSAEPQRRSPLHGRDQPLRRMRVCLTVGAVLGGLLGLVALSVTIGDRTTVVGILVGAASTAVVGGWVAFVAASAWSIFQQGWREAVAEHGRDRRDRRGDREVS
jgi:hypothetical protein